MEERGSPNACGGMFETEAKTLSAAKPSRLLEMKGEERGRGRSASGVLPEPPNPRGKRLQCPGHGTPARRCYEANPSRIAMLASAVK